MQVEVADNHIVAGTVQHKCQGREVNPVFLVERIPIVQIQDVDNVTYGGDEPQMYDQGTI